MTVLSAGKSLSLNTCLCYEGAPVTATHGTARHTEANLTWNAEKCGLNNSSLQYKHLLLKHNWEPNHNIQYKLMDPKVFCLSYK